MRPEYLVVHTSASAAREQDVQMIDAWHRALGWDGVGYHFVILDDRRAATWRDGEIQAGRALHLRGAHARGLNDRSLGICLVGDHDTVPHTQRQRDSLVWLCVHLVRHYGLDADRVLGHCEINGLVSIGVLAADYITDKTCPGTRVSMPEVRAAIRTGLARRG